MDRALGRRLAETAAVEHPLGHRDVTQMRHFLAAKDARKVLRRILTGLTTGRIGAVDQRVLGVGLDHHERDLRTHRNGLERVVAEVALDKRTLGAVHRGRLIEQSARAAGERVLRLLADLRHRRLVLLDAVELRKRENRAHLKRGGGRKAGAKRDVAEEHALPALRRRLRLAVEEPVERARHVILPGHLLRRSDRLRRELGRLHQVARRQLAAVVVGRGDREKRALVDRRGEHIASIVIGMVAEHLDAARSVGDDVRLLAVHLLVLANELVVDFLVLHDQILLNWD